MRRDLVALALLIAAGGASAAAPLTLHSLHTDERFELLPQASGGWTPAALAAARHGLRDHRNDREHDIDPALLDLLLALAAGCGREPSYQVISGYRSPESNAALRAGGHAVAAHSLHMEGRAIDVRLDGCTLARLRDLALALGRGGVGYYPHPGFVHVDTGRVRRWTG